MNLDRFSQGPPDPQQASPVDWCTRCGCQMYKGEDAYMDIDTLAIYCEDCKPEEYEIVRVGEINASEMVYLP